MRSALPDRSKRASARGEHAKLVQPGVEASCIMCYGSFGGANNVSGFIFILAHSCRIKVLARPVVSSFASFAIENLSRRRAVKKKGDGARRGMNLLARARPRLRRPRAWSPSLGAQPNVAVRGIHSSSGSPRVTLIDCTHTNAWQSTQSWTL
jgi:hypothetical protein